MIAALYVDARGCYAGLPDVDAWPESRDARKYTGPHPIVAHPPCARWGRMAESAFGRETGTLGEDHGCFWSALVAVRKWGGVIEHPANSRAWLWHGLRAPERAGWSEAGDGLGYVARVEQGHYGHRTRKATWLYAVRCDLPSLVAGESSPEGFTKNARKGETFTKLSRRQRSATPPAFRDLLIAMARSVKARAA